MERTILNNDERINVPASIFGSAFPFQVEPCIYNMASYIADDYKGGYWEMYKLSNGGFYMHPDTTESLKVVCDNYFNGKLSPDAFGIAACLYAYSYLSFSESPALSELCTHQYHWLREYTLEHPEVGAIMAAID